MSRLLIRLRFVLTSKLYAVFQHGSIVRQNPVYICLWLSSAKGRKTGDQKNDPASGFHTGSDPLCLRCIAYAKSCLGNQVSRNHRKYGNGILQICRNLSAQILNAFTSVSCELDFLTSKLLCQHRYYCFPVRLNRSQKFQIPLIPAAGADHIDLLFLRHREKTFLCLYPGKDPDNGFTQLFFADIHISTSFQKVLQNLLWLLPGSGSAAPPY